MSRKVCMFLILKNHPDLLVVPTSCMNEVQPHVYVLLQYFPIRRPTYSRLSPFASKHGPKRGREERWVREVLQPRSEVWPSHPQQPWHDTRPDFSAFSRLNTYIVYGSTPPPPLSPITFRPPSFVPSSVPLPILLPVSRKLPRHYRGSILH